MIVSFLHESLVSRGPGMTAGGGLSTHTQRKELGRPTPAFLDRKPKSFPADRGGASRVLDPRFHSERTSTTDIGEPPYGKNANPTSLLETCRVHGLIQLKGAAEPQNDACVPGRDPVAHGHRLGVLQLLRSKTLDAGGM